MRRSNRLDSRETPAPHHTAQRTEDHRARQDAQDLERLGYAQEFFRGFGGFSNFAISFSIISILTGAVTLFDYGLTMGGPLEMTLGWPLVTVGTLLVALSMAELCSALPTSGGMYHWSAELGGPMWAWFTAWLNIVGLVACIAGIDYGCAQFLVPLLGLESATSTLLIVYGLLLLSQAVINHYSTRWIAWLNDLSVTVHIAGVAVLIGALWIFAPKRPLSFLIKATSSSHIHGSYVWLFMLGLLQAQWTYTGFDASAHV
ncbi:MAG: amino acid permease, partial [Terriglobia bacterium]